MVNIELVTGTTSMSPTAAGNEDNPRPFEAGLPISTANEIDPNAKAIKAIVHREQGKTNGAPYILSIHVPPDIVNTSQSYPHTIGGRNIRPYYDESLRSLIVKLVDAPHALAGDQLNRMFSSAFTVMGLEEASVGTGAKRITAPPQSKEPDHSWRPLNPPQGRSPKWPTLVVECGWSESLTRLRLETEVVASPFAWGCADRRRGGWTGLGLTLSWRRGLRIVTREP